MWTNERYIENLASHLAPALSIDQVAIHVDGGSAVVSAHTSRKARRLEPLRGHIHTAGRRLALRPRLRLAPACARRQVTARMPNERLLEIRTHTASTAAGRQRLDNA
jgi:hypothetical protein